MNLIYRGVAYQPTSPIVTATDTVETAAFLGACFQRKRYTMVNRATQALELTYRGIRYNR